jgi:hypothetical protein
MPLHSIYNDVLPGFDFFKAAFIQCKDGDILAVKMFADDGPGRQNRLRIDVNDGRRGFADSDQLQYNQGTGARTFAEWKYGNFPGNRSPEQLMATVRNIACAGVDTTKETNRLRRNHGFAFSLAWNDTASG